MRPVIKIVPSGTKNRLLFLYKLEFCLFNTFLLNWDMDMSFSSFLHICRYKCRRVNTCNRLHITKMSKTFIVICNKMTAVLFTGLNQMSPYRCAVRVTGAPVTLLGSLSDPVPMQKPINLMINRSYSAQYVCQNYKTTSKCTSWIFNGNHTGINKQGDVMAQDGVWEERKMEYAVMLMNRSI